MAILKDMSSGTAYALAAVKVTIGRLPTNGISLPGNAISRRHAEIQAEDDRYFVRDLGSTYGTYVNGHRIDCQEDGLVELHDGDRVTLGVNSVCPEGAYTLAFGMEPVPGTTTTMARDSGSDGEGTIAYGEHEGCLVVKLEGDITGPACDAMVKDVGARSDGEPRDVVFDLSSVTFINSYAFNSFARVAEHLEAFGKTIAFAAADGQARRLLVITGLSGTYATKASVADAVAALRAD
jgi:anti-anti-sigma factor